MNDIVEKFQRDKIENIKKLGRSRKLKKMGIDFIAKTTRIKYSYNFTWLGRPIIQYPQDMIAMQEIIWRIKPDLVIETGIAHGGSLIYYASLLALIGRGEVLGIDIEIRPHNKSAIKKHPMYERIRLIEGSSVADSTIRRVYDAAKGKKKVIVCLDSSHTCEHVLKELKLYSPLVTVGSYCVVFDTIIEDLPLNVNKDRPWSKGNSPKSAVRQFIKEHKNFVIDKTIENKLIITTNPDGYLKRVRL